LLWLKHVERAIAQAMIENAHRGVKMRGECRGGFISGLVLLVAATVILQVLPARAASQAGGNKVSRSDPAPGSRGDAKPASDVAVPSQTPLANPGRPTVSTPATLTPIGYLQFETGVLAAWHSPEFSTQQSLGEVTKWTVSRWLELLAGTSPFVHSDTEPQNGTGDITLGFQGIVRHGEGASPTFALSYFRDVFSGGTPDLDIGSAKNSALVLASADVKSFHYDTNYIFNEMIDDKGVRRAQLGQTLSVSHGLGKEFGISGEIWNFEQPFLRSHATGNLWAVNYNAKRNLVFDLGFDRGLTTTSTRWEILAGFTYVLPMRIRLH
jgi:hypothetical protein